MCSKQYSTQLFLAIGKPALNSVDTFNCGDADVIKNTELGNCVQFIFAYESLHGNVTYKDLYYNPDDGWRGEWIRLVINGTIQKECSILTYIDGNHPDYFSSTNFVCPGGMTI